MTVPAVNVYHEYVQNKGNNSTYDFFDHHCWLFVPVLLESGRLLLLAAELRPKRREVAYNSAALRVFRKLLLTLRPLPSGSRGSELALKAGGVPGELALAGGVAIGVGGSR